MDAVEVVAAQLDAYNARDLERFLDCYTQEAVVEDGAGQPLVRGRDAIRAMYGQLFAQSPELHCAVRGRMIVGSYVVDEQSVTGFHLDGFPTELRAAAIYRVEGNRIAHLRLLM